MGDLDIISDLSYAWILIEEYTPVLHEVINKIYIYLFVFIIYFISLIHLIYYLYN